MWCCMTVILPVQTGSMDTGRSETRRGSLGRGTWRRTTEQVCVFLFVYFYLCRSVDMCVCPVKQKPSSLCVKTNSICVLNLRCADLLYIIFWFRFLCDSLPCWIIKASSLMQISWYLKIFISHMLL